MKEPLVNKKVKLDLTGVDGNAYVIMGAFKKQAQKEGWTEQEIEVILEEAKSKDYDHLLATILQYSE